MSPIPVFILSKERRGVKPHRVFLGLSEKFRQILRQFRKNLQLEKWLQIGYNNNCHRETNLNQEVNYDVFL